MALRRFLWNKPSLLCRIRDEFTAGMNGASAHRTGDVLFDSVATDVQLLRNLGRRRTMAEQADHVEFTGAEHGIGQHMLPHGDLLGVCRVEGIRILGMIKLCMLPAMMCESLCERVQITMCHLW